MRKPFYSKISTALIVIISGCNLSKSEIQNRNITGVWKVIKYDYKFTEPTLNASQKKHRSPINNYLEFKSDGTLIGKNETVLFGKWLIDGSRLHIEGGGVNFETCKHGFQIILLTSNELIIHRDYHNPLYRFRETISMRKQDYL